MPDLAQLITLDAASPFSNPGAWDQLVLGSGPTFTWLGRVDFFEAKRSFAWQFKHPQGIKGDINTYRGTHCNSFTMRVHVWTNAQWAQLSTLISFFDYDGTKIGPDGDPLANPVDIYHPALSIIRITQVICEHIYAPEIDKERSGAAWINFRLHEFLPAVPINVTKTPIAVGPAVVILNPSGGNLGTQIEQQGQAIQALGTGLGAAGTLP